MPDLFYVNADYAPEWIDQGFLEPLDDYIAKSGFDTSQFFPGYASIFKGTDGKTYGFPKDGNTIAMAYNTDLVTDAADHDGRAGHWPPRRSRARPASRRRCASTPASIAVSRSSTPRAAQLLTADGTASAIDTDASTAAVQWYLDLFKDGLGMTAATRAGWCGEALGKEQVADHLRRRLARPVHDQHLSRTSSTRGRRCRPARRASPVTISFTGQLLDRRRLGEQGPGVRRC